MAPCSEFLFRGGGFEPRQIVPIVPFGKDALRDALIGLGFQPSQNVGDHSGLSYVLHEHAEKGWVVEFRTAGKVCLVLCESWPDLIDLLGRYVSPIVQAACLTDEVVAAVYDWVYSGTR